ncbi:MAG: nucleoside hydrolase [Chloroflexi bacterium]|nr:nucleoside hydrolase [Chloroflexota bacterium]
MNMRKVWIDTDPGIDDTYAIAMLLADANIDIVGVSSVFGNVTVEKTTYNAKVLMEAAGLNKLPLARGANLPLHVPLDTSPFVHGANGLGDMPLPEVHMPEWAVRAPQAIIDIIQKYPHEITLLPIGPLTNIAMAYLIEPSIVDLVKEVVIMGGAVHCSGNITPAAEANFFHDPHAAQLVISAGWNVVLAGLDVCDKGRIPQALLEQIGNGRSPLAPYMKGALPFFRHFLELFAMKDEASLPDTMAAAYLLNPELFTIESTPLYIETEGACMGQSLAVPRGKWYEDPGSQARYDADNHLGMVDVLVDVDVVKFLDLMRDLLI